MSVLERFDCSIIPGDKWGWNYCEFTVARDKKDICGSAINYHYNSRSKFFVRTDCYYVNPFRCHRQKYKHQFKYLGSIVIQYLHFSLYSVLSLATPSPFSFLIRSLTIRQRMFYDSNESWVMSQWVRSEKIKVSVIETIKLSLPRHP